MTPEAVPETVPDTIGRWLRSGRLATPVRWGIVGVACVDAASSLLTGRELDGIRAVVQVCLLVACLMLAWRSAWGVILLLGLLPLNLLVGPVSVALVPITLGIGVGFAVCTPPLMVTFLGGWAIWFTVVLVTGNMEPAQGVGMAVFWVFIGLLGFLTSRVLGERRRDQARLLQLERERAEVISAERRAIARELHDVVAHAVSVIAVQARAARYEKSPEAAHQALDNIGDLSREALVDLRRLLRVLASDRDPTDDGADASDATVVQLRRQLIGLVDTMTSLGLRVEVQVPQEDPALPQSVATAVHRVAQEATTNVIKHAGPDARCTLSLEVEDDAVVLTVFNSPVVAATAAHLSSGFGLDSMRERVHMFDGTLEAGRQGDGWRVRARVPLR